jgi:molybdopterin/thiamine biosynthesis adenylyltransferase/molybdopterin converting factor small subunit
MKTRFSYLAQLRRAAGRAGDDVETPGPCTLAAALRLLAGARPELRALLLEGDEPRRSLLAFRDDVRLSAGDMLTADGEVTLMTPIAGGAALSDDERAAYEWQLWTPGFGEAGQEKLKAATVLVSRVGGVGGAAAQYLAMAGVGRLVLAHAGNVRPSDLNRQVLMTHAGLGRRRMDMAAHALKALNPWVEVVTVPENVSDANVERLVALADVVVSTAPLFAERLAMNRAAVRQGKPLVDCAMYDLTAQVMTVLPGRSACLACLYPEEPPGWRRQFPVFGAVAGVVGCLGAVEAIKLLGGLGEPLAGRLLLTDMSEMTFRRVSVARLAGCAVCGGAS